MALPVSPPTTPQPQPPQSKPASDPRVDADTKSSHESLMLELVVPSPTAMALPYHKFLGHLFTRCLRPILLLEPEEQQQQPRPRAIVRVGNEVETREDLSDLIRDACVLAPRLTFGTMCLASLILHRFATVVSTHNNNNSDRNERREGERVPPPPRRMVIVISLTAIVLACEVLEDDTPPIGHWGVRMRSFGWRGMSLLTQTERRLLQVLEWRVGCGTVVEWDEYMREVVVEGAAVEYFCAHKRQSRTKY